MFDPFAAAELLARDPDGLDRAELEAGLVVIRQFREWVDERVALALEALAAREARRAGGPWC
jgi:hypothetical protein